MDNQTRARVLVDELKLERTPVAFAFVDAPPKGIDVTAATEPSACTFWRQAEHGTFYAAADRHQRGADEQEHQRQQRQPCGPEPPMREPVPRRGRGRRHPIRPQCTAAQAAAAPPSAAAT